MEDQARLGQILKTVIEMLADRGYITSAIDRELPRDMKNRDDLKIYCVKKDDPTESIFVFFPEVPKVGVTHIKKYVEIMKTRQTNRAIIVVQQNITPFAKQALAEFSQDKKIALEQFNEAELLVNITHHQLVPKHILLTKEEKIELLTRYKMKESQLPRIQAADPVARYFGLARGNVVKIVRPSETAGRYITYRLCV